MQMCTVHTASAPNDCMNRSHPAVLSIKTGNLREGGCGGGGRVENLLTDEDCWTGRRSEGKSDGYLPVQKTIPICIATVEKTSESFLFAGTTGITATAVLTCRHRHCDCSSLAISHASPSKACLQRTASATLYSTRSVWNYHYFGETFCSSVSLLLSSHTLPLFSVSYCREDWVWTNQ